MMRALQVIKAAHLFYLFFSWICRSLSQAAHFKETQLETLLSDKQDQTEFQADGWKIFKIHLEIHY